MTQDEKDLIEEKLRSLHIQINAEFETAHSKLNDIFEQTKKTNGRVTKLEDKVQVLEMNDATHALKCPQAEKIKVLEKDVQKSNNLKSFIWFGIIIAGTITGIVVSIIKLFGN